MEKPKNQKRSIETQQKIIDATISLLATQGVSAITHRLVAKTAGVTLARVTYHFDSKEDLLNAAYQELHQREISRYQLARKELGNELLELEYLADFASTLIIRESTEQRTLALAGCELMLEAMRSNGFRDAAREVYDERIAFWEKALTDIRSEDTRTDAAVLLLLSVGKFIRLLGTGTNSLALSKIRQQTAFDIEHLFPNSN